MGNDDPEKEAFLLFLLKHYAHHLLIHIYGYKQYVKFEVLIHLGRATSPFDSLPRLLATLGFYALLILLVILGLGFSRWRRYEKSRKVLYDYLLSRKGEAVEALSMFLYRDRLGYFTNHDLTEWRTRYQGLYSTLKKNPIAAAKLPQTDLMPLNQFISYYETSEAQRDLCNQVFLQRELENYKGFFDTVTGHPLDLQQRTAIVQDEDANLVIAGAGSGKTTTIVGKVKYLVDRYKTDPSRILLISFTKKSAATLASRVGVEGVLAKTFHSFGIEVIREAEGRQPTIFDDNQLKPFLSKTFRELTRDEEYLKSVTDYFTHFLKPAREASEFEDQGKHIQYLKDQNFRTYKAVEHTFQGRTTYRQEVVKSIEECQIANFLLFHSLDYQYEQPYEHDTATYERRQYRPDFTVTQGERRVYIEHQALSKENTVPPFFRKAGQTQEQANAAYLAKAQWARDTHREYNTALIETFTHEMADNTLFPNLKRNLEEAGIVLTPKTPSERWEIIQQAASEEVEAFLTLFQTFLSLMKSNNHSFLDLLEKNDRIKDKVTRKRNKRFLQIIRPILEAYERHLSERQEIDFSDMVNRAAALVREGRYKREFDYIIIDEFQDISVGRYKLIKALREANPACRLFCVGDDWQSIYRFTGSDISLFKDFERYFGFSIRSRIETTYRFFEPLIKLSGDFILKNPNQTKKDLKAAFPDRRTDFRLRYSRTGDHKDIAAVAAILRELAVEFGDLNKKSVYILGRYGFDIDRLSDDTGTFTIHRNREIKEQINGKVFSRTTDLVEYSPLGLGTVRAEFMTVHRSKGLEADFVVVITATRVGSVSQPRCLTTSH